MNHFLQELTMGGYFFYVWTAYGLVCSVLVLHVLAAKLREASVRKWLNQRLKR